MKGLRALLLGVRFGLALDLAAGLACGVVDVKTPGPPPPCPSDSPAPLPHPEPPPPTSPPPAQLSPPPTFTPAPAPSAKPLGERDERACPPDMIQLPSFCIDRYEAPNVPGDLPFSLRTASEGEQWCGARGKRLCSETEWVRACEGPHRRRFPYGDAHRASACNDDRVWIPVSWKTLALWPDPVAVAEAGRLFQADVSGARGDCVSEEGVYDLTGNVAEWVRRDEPAPHPGYEHVLKGCYWAGCYHEPEPNCAFRNSAHPGSFRTYEAGFRCCGAIGADQASQASAASPPPGESPPGESAHPQ